MALFIRSREELEHLLVGMHSEGWRIRALSRHFKIGRNTVRRILRKHRKQRDEGHDVLQDQKSRVPRQSKLDPFKPAIKELLKKFPNITGQRLYEELRDKGYDGGISILGSWKILNYRLMFSYLQRTTTWSLILRWRDITISPKTVNL